MAFRSKDHRSLTSVVDVDDGRWQSARLTIHLHRNRLRGLQTSGSALRQAYSTVGADLQPRLRHTITPQCRNALLKASACGG